MQTDKECLRFLFIGEERICKQIAYVLSIDNYDIQNFSFLENDSSKKIFKQQNYKIYICEFKNKAKKLLKNKKFLFKLKNIFFLNEICYSLDKEYKMVCYRRRFKIYERLRQTSIFSSLKFLIYDFIKTIYHRLKCFQTMRSIKKFNYEKAKKEQLKYLKPSELFLYVLNAPLNKHIQCTILEKELHLIDSRIAGCCGAIVPFGDLLKDESLEVAYNSTYARIIKLSSLNNSYCLCDVINQRCPFYKKKENNINLKPLITPKIPECIVVSIDSTCNLCCKSCRNEFYVLTDKKRKELNIMQEKILSSSYINQAKTLLFAASGEVFYSPTYRRLLDSNLKRDSIYILSNGILFNENNYNWLKEKFSIIDVRISVDAATKETYTKLRGGNFDTLMKNLEMISDLHSRGKVREFILNFVVQRDNFQEMPSFVKLGKNLGVDFVEFQHLCNFGNLTNEEFLSRSLIINNEYLSLELWNLLQNPIFEDPIVDLQGFNRYIEMSKLYYNKKN